MPKHPLFQSAVVTSESTGKQQALETSLLAGSFWVAYVMRVLSQARLRHHEARKLIAGRSVLTLMTQAGAEVTAAEL